MASPAFNPPLPFSRPLLPPLSRVARAVETGWERGSVTKGEILESYEAQIARHLGVSHAVALSSCTTGLILGIRSLELTGECLIPAFTFTATVQALLWNGLVPVFVDCHPKKFTVDLESISRSLTPRTSAVAVPYVFGNPPPLDELEKFCAQKKLALVIDSAHGFGSNYHGKPSGSHGAFEVFSTSATKLLCTGEGGVLTTRDSALAQRARSLREYGHGSGYETVAQGLNGRMAEFQAALGIESLKLLEKHAARRNALAEKYRAFLSPLPFSFQEIEPQSRSSYKDFAVVMEEGWPLTRDEFAGELEKEGIPTRKYFSPPLHLQKFFQVGGASGKNLPNTERICERILCLPMFFDLKETEIGLMAEVMSAILGRVKA